MQCNSSKTESPLMLPSLLQFLFLFTLIDNGGKKGKKNSDCVLTLNNRSCSVCTFSCLQLTAICFKPLILSCTRLDCTWKQMDAAVRNHVIFLHFAHKWHHALMDAQKTIGLGSVCMIKAPIANSKCHNQVLILM